MPDLPKPKLPPKPACLSVKKDKDQDSTSRGPPLFGIPARHVQEASSKVATPRTTTPAVDVDRKVFYVNVTIYDASAAIFDKVQQKLQEKQAKLPGPVSLKEKVSKGVASKVAEKVPPAKIASKVSDKMVKLLPVKMKEKGITVSAERVFLEGPFFVIQLQIRHVDTVKLAETSQEAAEDDDDSISSVELDALIAKQEEEKNSELVVSSKIPRKGLLGWIEWILELIGISTRERLEGTYLPALVQNKMSTVMAEMLRKKFDGKNIEAEAEVLSEEKQARYFFANLKKVRNKTE